jgi:hypothetical protein
MGTRVFTLYIYVCKFVHRNCYFCMYIYMYTYQNKYRSDCTLQSEKLSAAAMSSQSAEEITSRKIFARAFPKILCTLSNVKEGGYFSYKDSTFQVPNSKRGTGRVVSWRELGMLSVFGKK